MSLILLTCIWSESFDEYRVSVESDLIKADVTLFCEKTVLVETKITRRVAMRDITDWLFVVIFCQAEVIYQ